MEEVAREQMVPPGEDLNVNIFQRLKLVEEQRSAVLRVVVASRAEVLALGGQQLQPCQISSELVEEGGQLLVWALGEQLEEVVVEEPWHPRSYRSQGEEEEELAACSSRPVPA